MAPPETAQSDALSAVLSDLVSDDDLHLALDGERLLFGEWVFSLPYRKEVQKVELAALAPEEAMQMKMYNSFITRPMFQADHAAYLRHLGVRAHDFSADRNDVEDDDIPGYCIFTRMLVPALAATISKFHELEARIEKTQNLLAGE